MAYWKFTVGIEEQTQAFLEGFNQVVPLGKLALAYKLLI
jgi:hypothetical protein